MMTDPNQQPQPQPQQGGQDIPPAMQQMIQQGQQQGGGMIQPSQQGQQPVPAGGKQPARDWTADPFNEADAEQLEKMETMAIKLLHSPQSRQTVLQRIGVSDKGPLDDMSDMTVMLVDRIDQEEKKQNGKGLEDNVKILGANAVVGGLIEVAEAAGKVPELSEDERGVVYSHAIQKYLQRMLKRGEITATELEMYANEAAMKATNNPDIDFDMGKVKIAEAKQAASETKVKRDPFEPKETMTEKLERGLLK